jgi:hypothetical protein
MYSYLVRTINFSVDDVWTFQAGPQREQTQSIPSGLIRSACRYRTGRYKPVGANCTWRLLFTFREAPGNDSGIGKRCVETVAALTAPVMMTRKTEGVRALFPPYSLSTPISLMCTTLRRVALSSRAPQTRVRLEVEEELDR